MKIKTSAGEIKAFYINKESADMLLDPECGMFSLNLTGPIGLNWLS